MSRNNRDLGWEADSWGSSSSGSFSNSSASFGSAAGGSAYRNQDSWSSDLQQLQANMQAIQQLVGELDLQLPRIGTVDDSDDFRSRVQAKINDTRVRIKQSDDLIKSLERLENSGATVADNSKRRNVLSKSKKDFKVLIDRFKVLGKMWMDKSKSRTSNLSQPSYQSQLGTEHYYQQPPSGFESQPLISQSNNAQLLQQVNRYESEIQFRQYMANERDQEAQDIERGVADLAEIFQDFKNAVDAQQDLVDSIENNVSQAVDHSRQGVAQLEAAKGHQESARSKLYCVGLIVIVILGILVALAALGVSIKYLF